MPEKRPESKIDKHIREPINHMMDAMNQFFNERPPNGGILQSIDGFFTATHSGGGFPAELQENDREYIVIAQLPGVKKEDIEIEVLHQHVTISAKTISREIPERKITGTRASRTIPLTKPIDPGKVGASYVDGVLRVTIPKRRGKKIEIN